MKLLNSLHRIGIREGEAGRAFLMFSYIFMVIAALLILKPVRNSLFLTAFGPEQLPYAFIAIAIFSAAATILYSKLTERLRLNRLIGASMMFFIVVFLLAWFILHINLRSGWFIYFFYIIAGIFGIFSASQFWLIANQIFNVREAKRLFGFLGSGAIMGGIFGGYLTNYIAPVIGSANMILICVALIGLCYVVLNVIWRIHTYRYQGQGQESSKIRQASLKKPLELIVNSKHLLYIAGMIAVCGITANLVDYQFNAVASAKISDPDELTAFFGFWFSNISIVSLLIQLLLTGIILKKFGVGSTLFFLPAAVALGAAAILIAPAIWAAVLIKVGEGSFKQSINKSGMELLALPIPAGIKDKTKTFIDVFVDNLATGIAGILLIVLTIVLKVEVQYISLIIIGLVGLQFIQIRLVKKEYINSFRLAIEKRLIDLTDPKININDASVAHIFRRVFEGGNDRQILYVMKLMEGLPHQDFMKYFKPLIKHSNNEVKAQMFRMSSAGVEPDFTEEAYEMVSHRDPEVQIEAMDYLVRCSSDPAAALELFLKSADMKISAAAMKCAAKEYRRNKKNIDIVAYFKDVFSENRYTGSDFEQRIAFDCCQAEVIGIALEQELYPFLFDLFKHQSTEVTVSAIESAGKTQALVFIPVLLKSLEMRQTKLAARNALAAYGDIIIDKIGPLLGDDKQSADIRVNIAKILGKIESPKSLILLQDNLHAADMKIRYEIIKAMNKLKNRTLSIKPNDNIIEKILIEEFENYNLLSAIYRAHNNSYYMSDKVIPESIKARKLKYNVYKLLKKAIKERIDVNLERIFRLLALKYSPKDIYNAYLAVVGDKPDSRANALEFIENILDTQFKRNLVPIIERGFSEKDGSNLPGKYSKNKRQELDYLTTILDTNDQLLKTFAIYYIAHAKKTRMLPKVTEFLQSSNRLVKETAEYTVRELTFN